MAVGSCESAWIVCERLGLEERRRTGCRARAGDRGAPGEGLAAAVAGASNGLASWMIWSGTTSATAGLAASRASSPGDTVAATALMVV